MYDIDFMALMKDVSDVRAVLKLKNKRFGSFSDMAQYVLNHWGAEFIPHLRLLLSISLVMPFATADCERSFSTMNRIKSAERSRMKEILNSLMRIYTLRGNVEDFKEIKKEKFETVSSKVAHKIWKREGYRKDSYYDNIFIV